jgi:hypothetical protein
MTRPHQPGQAVFRSILPEDIDWQPFPAFPPAVRLAVIVGHPSEPGPLRHQGESARRHKTDAAQASGGPDLSGVFYIGLGDQFDGDRYRLFRREA